MNWFHRQVCRSGRWRRRVRGLLPWALQGVELGDDVLEIGPGSDSISYIALPGA